VQLLVVFNPTIGPKNDAITDENYVRRPEVAQVEDAWVCEDSNLATYTNEGDWGRRGYLRILGGQNKCQ
jgi:hypothetical protein